MERRTYSIDHPQEMILKQAPNAGSEAKRIWDQGVFNKQPTLTLKDEVSLQEAIRNSFSFVQLYGLRGGESSQVAAISAGLPWDRQRPMEETAAQIVEQILGGKGQLRWFGQHKLVGFLESDEESGELLERFVEAPRDAYREHFPNLSQVVNDLQDLRVEEVLNLGGQNGERFRNISSQNQTASERAYRDDNQHTFVWDYQKDQSGQLWGKNLDNQPQSMTSLALESPDLETTEMLLAIQDYFKGNNRLNRYVVEFDFSATVSCCNISFNAQQVSRELANFRINLSGGFSSESGVVKCQGCGFENTCNKNTCAYCKGPLKSTIFAY